MDNAIIGVDVGGTFTDVIAASGDGQSFCVAKVPSTPEDQAIGFLAGVDALKADIAGIQTIVHGTTVGTNALLERKGARCGLITTRGFRDVLEMGRRVRPRVYGLGGRFEALIPRDMRLEVTERMTASGDVDVPLDEDEFVAAVRLLIERGTQALVIHFLHSYVNPLHEQRGLELAKGIWPNAHITAGHQILPEIREFERGNTAAVNGYLQPVMSRYLDNLSHTLKARSFRNELLIMQGNGGMMDATIAGQQAAHTVMSGPAAGAVAAAHIGAQAGFPNLVSCDMGGTSFDVALVVGGVPAVSAEKEIDYSLPIHVPMVDIHTIGAGGGSIARIDRGGILKVGPQSAGAFPGPVCYGRGGTEPTVTDANYVMGRFRPDAIPRLKSVVEAKEVEAVIAEKIGKPLGLSAVDAAEAIVAIANNGMAGAIRYVSVEKGHDPRDFAILAFGGAGPLHCSALARELAIPRVIVPRYPGITSAIGCVLSDVRHDFSQTVFQPLDELDGTDADAILSAHAERGRRMIEDENVSVADVMISHEADLLYEGQTHVFRIPTGRPFTPAQVRADFAHRYTERFDIDLSEMRPFLAALRTTVIGRRTAFDLRQLAPSAAGSLKDAVIGSRSVYVAGTWHEASVYERAHLPRGAKISGPAIVEQEDSTVFIEPGDRAEVDDWSNIRIVVGSASDASGAQ